MPRRLTSTYPERINRGVEPHLQCGGTICSVRDLGGKKGGKRRTVSTASSQRPLAECCELSHLPGMMANALKPCAERDSGSDIRHSYGELTNIVTYNEREPAPGEKVRGFVSSFFLSK